MPRKGRSRNKDPLLDKFAQEISADHEKIELRINPAGEISMSDVISVLIEPYREDAPDLHSLRNLVAFACLAWNMTLMPGAERKMRWKK